MTVSNSTLNMYVMHVRNMIEHEMDTQMDIYCMKWFRFNRNFNFYKRRIKELNNNNMGDSLQLSLPLLYINHVFSPYFPFLPLVLSSPIFVLFSIISLLSFPFLPFIFFDQFDPFHISWYIPVVPTWCFFLSLYCQKLWSVGR
jgi:hypothetical protein